MAAGAAEEIDEDGLAAEDVLVDQDGHDLVPAEGLEDGFRGLEFLDDAGPEAGS